MEEDLLVVRRQVSRMSYIDDEQEYRRIVLEAIRPFETRFCELLELLEKED